MTVCLISDQSAQFSIWVDFYWYNPTCAFKSCYLNTKMQSCNEYNIKLRMYFYLQALT